MNKKLYMNDFDKDSEKIFNSRSIDWRNGCTIYQIFVDRFSYSKFYDQKKDYYKHPRRLVSWDTFPKAGFRLDNLRCMSHELDFWGGDIEGIVEKLEYLKELGFEVVYLNPIFEAFTNHKYDTIDYYKVDGGFGTNDDLKRLIKELHSNNIKIILDGVFNHMGYNSLLFQEAISDKQSRFRKYFKFISEDSMNYISWMNNLNLPQLNLENPEVRKWLYESENSVLQTYLREYDIDGWRLDVAFDLGFEILKEITYYSHKIKSNSYIVGEVWNYPKEWHCSLDGILNMHGRKVLLKMILGEIPAKLALDMWETMIKDTGIENFLKNWLVLDNHDTPRLASIIEDTKLLQLARILQFTLPGSVCMYYGSEINMKGGNDPECRAPMPWNEIDKYQEEINFYKKLISLRKSNPALRFGDFIKLHSKECFTFLRRTNKVSETVVVVANVLDRGVNDFIQIRDSKLMDVTEMIDILSHNKYYVNSGCIEAYIPAKTAVVLKPLIPESEDKYNRYARIY